MDDERNIHLTACPFCGATDLLQTDKMEQECSATAGALQVDDEPVSSPDDEWFVVCGDCGAMGPMSPSVEEAHAAWNRRV